MDDRPHRDDPRPDPASPEACLVRAVAETMKREPTLEAVKIDRGRKSISVATLGSSDATEVEQHLSRQIEKLHTDDPERRCGLLEGEGDCSVCSRPLPPDEQAALLIDQRQDITTIAKVTCPTAPRFWRWHDLPWPRYLPRTVRYPEEEDHEQEWKHQLLAAGVCGVCGLAAWLTGTMPWAGVLYALAYLSGAWYTVEEVRERLRKGVLDVHFLMLAVAAGSAAIGAYAEGAVLLFLFSLSGALEHYALGRTHREIRSLFKEAPKVATVVDASGQHHEEAVASLRPGMRLLVKPDQQFPVDAEIVEGETASDESNLTGEAIPVSKAKGDVVYAGTINLWGSVEAVVQRAADDSALQRIIHLIQEAQQRKAPSQRFTDKFGTRYTYVILATTAVMFFVWWLPGAHPPLVSTPDHPSAFYRAMTLLVVASPCALVLSIPSAVLAAIAWAARRGILFRGGAAVEKLADISIMAMDKTGTLTTGELKVEWVESFPPGREAEVARLAYSLEQRSHHPLARAVTRHGKQQELAPVDLKKFESVTGQGVQAQWEGRPVRLGRRGWVADELPAGLVDSVPAVAVGSSEMWLVSGDLAGRLVLRDDIRTEAREVVESLRRAGLRSIVLTGDREEAAQYLKEHLCPDEVRAELRPEEKVAVIESLTAKGERVAMVGDGVNDAPSLAAAHVGMAMGARGSDAALEQAEVVLMHDRLENALTAYRLSRRARRIIRQNLVVSLGTVVVLVTAAMLGEIPLTLGVLGHEGSTVIVVMNSLRLLVSRGAKRKDSDRSDRSD